jgi:c-di-GMP-binding flagellar brake protein YcgR
MDADNQYSVSRFFDVGDSLTVTVGSKEKSAEIHTFETQIKGIQEERLFIALPENLEFFHEKMPITVRFMKGKGHLPSISTQVLTYAKAQTFGCWIEIPRAFVVDILQRRRHMRVPMRFTAKIQYVEDGQSLTIPAEGVNLSGGGIRFTSLHRFQGHENLVVEFQPDPSIPAFTLQAEVVFSGVAVTRNSFVTALKFINLRQYEEDRLIGICFRTQMKMQKHLF